jgi:hypothetical protein
VKRRFAECAVNVSHGSIDALNVTALARAKSIEKVPGRQNAPFAE